MPRRRRHNPFELPVLAPALTAVPWWGWAGAAVAAAYATAKVHGFGRPTPSQTHAGVAPQGSRPLLTTELAYDANRTGNYEIYTMNTDGSGITQLTDDPRYDSWWPKIGKRNRGRILFYRAPAGVHDTDFGQQEMWIMNSDGTDQTLLIANKGYGWSYQGHGDWSPDDSRIVMFGTYPLAPGVDVTQIFTTDANGKDPRLVPTPVGQSLDPSFSPDGSILFTSCSGLGCDYPTYEIYRANVDGSGLRRLTVNNWRDHDSYFSPDMSKFAWLACTDPTQWGGAGSWSTLVANADGSNVVNLTAANVTNINSKPQWHSNGRQIFSHFMDPAINPVFNLIVLDLDGRKPTLLTTSTTFSSEFPSL